MDKNHSFIFPYVYKFALNLLSYQHKDGSFSLSYKNEKGSCVWSSASVASILIDVLGHEIDFKEQFIKVKNWILKYGSKSKNKIDFSIDSQSAIIEYLCKYKMLYHVTDIDLDYYINDRYNLLIEGQNGGWYFWNNDENELVVFSTFWAIKALHSFKQAFPEKIDEVEKIITDALDWLMFQLKSKRCNSVENAIIIIAMKLFGNISDDNYHELVCNYLDIHIVTDMFERHDEYTVCRFCEPWHTLSFSLDKYIKENERQLCNSFILKHTSNVFSESFYQDKNMPIWKYRDCLIALFFISKLNLFKPLEDLIVKKDNCIRVNNLSRITCQTLRILHLSDLHIDINSPINSMVENIFNDLKKINKVKIDIIVISGDLICNINRNIGSQIEFEKVKEFLDYLTIILNIEKDKLIIVPGNHDVDWMSDDIKSSNIYNSNTSLINYSNFYTSYFFEKPKKYNNIIKYYKNYNIVVVGFNSCLLCNSRDKSWTGFVGKEQIYNCITELQNLNIETDAMFIAVLHHHLVPVSYTEDYPNNDKSISLTLDAEGILKELIINDFNLVLHGHQHQPFISIEGRVINSSRNYGDLIISGGGSIGAKRNELGLICKNTYNLVEIDKNQLSIIIRQSDSIIPNAYCEYSNVKFKCD